MIIQVWLKTFQQLPVKHGFQLGKSKGFTCHCKAVQSGKDIKGKPTLIVTFTDGEKHEFSKVESFSVAGYN